MTIIRVPVSVEVSPQDGSQLRLQAEMRVFVDDTGNTWSADDLAASRPSNRLRKWLDENYSLSKEGNDRE